jgi:hypothetical protein
MKEGRDVIQNGFAELRALGYVTEIRFRNKITKEFKGSFWAVTDVPYHFLYHGNKRILDNLGCEVISRKSAILPHNTESPYYGKSVTNNNNYYKTEIPEGISSKKSGYYTCPKGWMFGQDYNDSIQGCIDCNYDHPRLYQKCQTKFYELHPENIG